MNPGLWADGDNRPGGLIPRRKAGGPGVSGSARVSPVLAEPHDKGSGDHDEPDDQGKMDEAAQRVGADQSEHPEHDENDADDEQYVNHRNHL